jgi:hypothetical protein
MSETALLNCEDVSRYTNIHTEQRGSLKMLDSCATRSRKVTIDGKIGTHATTALLSELAGRSGLTEAMSQAMPECGISWHTHDPGVVLTHLGGHRRGADCWLTWHPLREQAELFGCVASIAMAWRAVDAAAEAAVFELLAVPETVATARAKVWAASPHGDSLVFDFDATFVNSRSE